MEIGVALDTVWVLLSAALVFFMQAGFAMVETGFTRAKNAGNIIMKNLMDFSVGSVTFFIFGFSIMFGESVGGVFGKIYLFSDSTRQELLDYHHQFYRRYVLVSLFLPLSLSLSPFLSFFLFALFLLFFLSLSLCLFSLSVFALSPLFLLFFFLAHA